MHNFFGWGQCYSQSVLVTYIVAHHFFGYAYHQALLFLVTHNNSCTNRFDYIHCYTPHSCLCTLLHTTFFWLGTILFTIFWLHTSLHTTFFTTHIYIIAHIFFFVVHNVMHNTLFGCPHHHAQLLLVMHIVTHNFFVMHNIMHNTLLVTHISWIYTMKNNMVLFFCIVLQLTWCYLFSLSYV